MPHWEPDPKTGIMRYLIDEDGNIIQDAAIPTGQIIRGSSVGSSEPSSDEVIPALSNLSKDLRAYFPVWKQGIILEVNSNGTYDVLIKGRDYAYEEVNYLGNRKLFVNDCVIVGFYCGDRQMPFILDFSGHMSSLEIKDYIVHPSIVRWSNPNGYRDCAKRSSFTSDEEPYLEEDGYGDVLSCYDPKKIDVSDDDYGYTYSTVDHYLVKTFLNRPEIEIAKTKSLPGMDKIIGINSAYIYLDTASYTDSSGNTVKDIWIIEKQELTIKNQIVGIHDIDFLRKTFCCDGNLVSFVARNGTDKKCTVKIYDLEMKESTSVEPRINHYLPIRNTDLFDEFAERAIFTNASYYHMSFGHILSDTTMKSEPSYSLAYNVQSLTNANDIVLSTASNTSFPGPANMNYGNVISCISRKQKRVKWRIEGATILNSFEYHWTEENYPFYYDRSKIMQTWTEINAYQLLSMNDDYVIVEKIKIKFYSGNWIRIGSGWVLQMTVSVRVPYEISSSIQILNLETGDKIGEIGLPSTSASVRYYSDPGMTIFPFAVTCNIKNILMGPGTFGNASIHPTDSNYNVADFALNDNYFACAGFSSIPNLVQFDETYFSTMTPFAGVGVTWLIYSEYTYDTTNIDRMMMAININNESIMWEKIPVGSYTFEWYRNLMIIGDRLYALFAYDNTLHEYSLYTGFELNICGTIAKEVNKSSGGVPISNGIAMKYTDPTRILYQRKS